MKMMRMILIMQELLTGAEYNDKSDVWSLGCILYELCSLRPPFHADSHLDLVKKVTSGRLQRIPAGYSDDLFVLISTLLEVDVSDSQPCVLFDKTLLFPLLLHLVF